MSAILLIGPIKQSLAGITKHETDVVKRRVQSLDDFRQVSAEFINLEKSVTLILYDVSSLRGSARLAKFVEEYPHRVVCLASIDNLDAMTLSRFYRIIKHSTVTSKFAQRLLPVNLADAEDPMVEVLEKNPLLLPEVLLSSSSRYKKRLLTVLQTTGT